VGVADSIYTRAITHGGLKTLIGETRCYPRIPDNPTFPLVRYTFVSTPPNAYLDHEAAVDRTTSRVQFDAYASTVTAARQLGDQVFDAFHKWSSGTAVGWSFVVNRFSSWDPGFDKQREVLEVVFDHSIA